MYARTGVIVNGDLVTVVLGRFGPVIAQGLRQVLSNDPTIRVVGEGLGSTQLEDIVLERRPDVAILNEACVVTPDLPRRLRDRLPRLGLIVLAARPTRAHAMRLLAFGVTSCLPTDASAADISTAIHLAAKGVTVLDATEAPSPHAPSPGGANTLTRRESDVLECLRLGQKNAEIALALGISVETVRSHAKRVYRKLGVRTRQDLLGVDSASTEGTSPNLSVEQP